GNCQLPVHVRVIDSRPLVVADAGGEINKTAGLEIEDIITHLDGVPVAKLVEDWTPYYAAGNEPTRLRDMANFFTRGNCGAATVRAQRGSETLEIPAERLSMTNLKVKPSQTHDLPGETFQLLSDQVAYLKFSGVKASQGASYI